MLVNCAELKVPVLPFSMDWYAHEEDGQNTATCVTSKSLWFLGYSANDTERPEFPLHPNPYLNYPLHLDGLVLYILLTWNTRILRLYFHGPFHQLYYWWNPSLTKDILSPYKMLCSQLPSPSHYLSSSWPLNTSWSALRGWLGTKCPAFTVWVETVLRTEFLLSSSQQMVLASLQVKILMIPGTSFFTDFGAQNKKFIISNMYVLEPSDWVNIHAHCKQGCNREIHPLLH